jgi:hypothetical protein
MKQPWFDINHLLRCPNCNKSEGVALVWSGGDNHRGKHEDDFVCGLCKCEFTAVYMVKGIEIIEEGEKINV